MAYKKKTTGHNKRREGPPRPPGLAAPVANFDWTGPFLDALRQVPFITVACRRVDIAYQNVYARMKRDSAFADAVKEARRIGKSRLLEAAWNTGVEGIIVEEKRNSKGKVIEVKRKYSPEIMKKLLECLVPSQFRERKELNIGGQAGKPIEIIEIDIPDREAAQKYKRLTRQVVMAADDGQHYLADGDDDSKRLGHKCGGSGRTNGHGNGCTK